MSRKIPFLLLGCTLLSLPSFCVEEERGPFVFAAPVYWRAEGNGLAYAVEGSSTTELSPSTVKQLHFDWDIGFQIGLGYRIPHDLWSLSLGLKHIHTNAHGDEKVGAGRALFPTWSLPAPFFAEKVHAHWRLHLGLLDLLLAKEWKVTPRVTFAPRLGVRSAWIRQKYNLEYTRGSIPPESVRMKNKFWGIGPALGVDATWEMVPHFSLFGEALLSLLYGQFYLHQDEDTTLSKVKLLGIHSIFKDSTWTADLSLGLRWGLKGLALELAWDQIFLAKQNQLIRFISSSSRGLFVSNQGDLSLMGVHFGARLDF